MSQFINHPVANWARQNLSQTIEVRLKETSVGHKILLGFSFAFLGLVFLGIPLLFYVSAITTYIHDGWNQKVSGALTGGTFFLAAFVIFCLVIFFFLRFTRRKFAKTFSAEGVKTRGGQKLVWEKLHFLNYKKVSTRVSSRNFALNMVSAAILAGVEKVTVEMVFENGVAIVPPLIQHQNEILAFLDSIPVQRRDEGKVREHT